MRTTITGTQRRTRLVRRHRLSPAHAARRPTAAGPDVAAGPDAGVSPTGEPSPVLRVAHDLLVLHASDPATVYLSVLARAPEATLADVAGELYGARSLVRMMAMRRTLFVVPGDLAPVVHHGASREVAARMRRRLLTELGTYATDPEPPADLEPWLEAIEAEVVAAVCARGRATGAQLSEDVPRLRTALLPRSGKKWDVRRNITTQVLVMMGAEGRLVRTEPRGDWTSRQHQWEPASAWWPDGIGHLDPAHARAELVRLWLQRFGPATVADLQWWTGWTLGATRTALAALEPVEVDLDGADGLALADDLDAGAGRTGGPGANDPDGDPAAYDAPGAALLPALDPTPMGWKQRDWFTAADPAALYDRNGNIGPTLWWDGEIVGGWAVRPGGEVAWRMLADRGREAERAVAEVAAGLQARLGGAAVVPSFPTPLETELRTG